MRPRVLVNCAMSADGKIALPNRKQMKISSEEDMMRVHVLRNEVDAILVGIGTVLNDDPKLTVKQQYVDELHHPVRVVLDVQIQTPVDAAVVNKTAPTLLFISKDDSEQKKYGSNVELIPSPLSEEGKIDIHYVLEELGSRGVESLLVEGGSEVIWSFLNAGLVDEMTIYVGPIVIGGNKTPTPAGGTGAKTESDCIPLRLKSVHRVGDGVLLGYVKR